MKLLIVPCSHMYLTALWCFVWSSMSRIASAISFSLSAIVGSQYWLCTPRSMLLLEEWSEARINCRYAFTSIRRWKDDRSSRGKVYVSKIEREVKESEESVPKWNCIALCYRTMSICFCMVPYVDTHCIYVYISSFNVRIRACTPLFISSTPLNIGSILTIGYHSHDSFSTSFCQPAK